LFNNERANKSPPSQPPPPPSATTTTTTTLSKPIIDDDPIRCNSCSTLYDLNLKSKSSNRKIIDTCGHAICFAW
jgi:hypothetical protein